MHNTIPVLSTSLAGSSDSDLLCLTVIANKHTTGTYAYSTIHSYHQLTYVSTEMLNILFTYSQPVNAVMTK